ncbi:MAG: hypothetical protein AAGC55_09565, partial [Myxococcota bacterium]
AMPAVLTSLLDEQPGPAKRISEQRAAALVAAALDAAMPAPTSQASANPGPATSRATAAYRRSPWKLVLMAAIVVATTGAAAAGIYRLAAAPTPDGEPGPASPASGEQRPAPIADGPAPQLDEPASEPRADGLATAPEPAGSRQVEAERVESARPGPTESLPSAERRPERPEPRPKWQADKPAADLLRLANEARKTRNWRRADRYYQSVLSGGADRTATYVAAVASASIRLEKLGRPKSALALYRKALRLARNGALAEEARWGIAAAHRALGQAKLERRALEEFIARHPDSPQVAQARQRLRDLL